MSLQAIRALLVGALIDSAIWDEVNIAVENLTFLPPSNQAWAEVSVLVSSIGVSTLGNGGQDRVDGILQVDIYEPVNTGSKAAFDKLDTLRGKFVAGHSLHDSDNDIFVIFPNGPRPEQPAVEKSFYRLTVSIPFYSHITRTPNA